MSNSDAIRPYTYEEAVTLPVIESAAFMTDVVVKVDDFRVLVDHEYTRVIYQVNHCDEWRDVYWEDDVFRLYL